VRRLIVAAVTTAAVLAPAGTASADTTTDTRVCIRPLGYVTPCLETVICGAPSTIARAAGLDEYGIDPTVNCVH
jgi:hypothetical protein